MNENTRVVFAGLQPDGIYTLRTVPGEFVLDSPRGAGQDVNPELVGDVAVALDTVVNLGGSYAIDGDTRQVIYAGLAGPGVRRDAVREPVLARLASLKDLKYLEIWRDPSISRDDWPAYEGVLKAFNLKVPGCSISLAVPTTLWVRGLSPSAAEGDDEGPQEISQMTLKIRALNLKRYYTIANRDFAAMVVKTINGNPYFGGDPETEEGSTLSEGMTNVGTEDLFIDFEINLVLEEPLKLNDLGGAGTLANTAEEGQGSSDAPANEAPPQGIKKEF